MKLVSVYMCVCVCVRAYMRAWSHTQAGVHATDCEEQTDLWRITSGQYRVKCTVFFKILPIYTRSTVSSSACCSSPSTPLVCCWKSSLFLIPFQLSVPCFFCLFFYEITLIKLLFHLFLHFRTIYTNVEKPFFIVNRLAVAHCLFCIRFKKNKNMFLQSLKWS